MKIFKLFVALAAFVLSLGAQATTYDFSLTTKVGYSIAGSFTGNFDGSAVTFEAPTSFSGTLTRASGSSADLGIVSGSISGLQVSTDGTGWLLGFTVGTASYMWNSNVSQYLGTTVGGFLLKADTNTVKIRYAGLDTQTTNDILGSPSAYIGVQVPEIDGSKIPQAALLILALVFMVRRLKASRPAPGFRTQFA